LTLEAVRRSPLERRALPNSEAVCAVAAPFATRWSLRGGADVVAPVAEAFGLAPPTEPLTSASDGARAAFWLGPDEWQLLDEDLTTAWGARLEAALAGVFHSLVDVSHRQTAIELSGPGAARVLSASVPLDLDLEAFPVGMVTRTLLIKAEVILWRRGAESFRLETGRSFAPYVAAVLTRSAEDQERS
jgi:sarcosine oxidase subunit gamma